MADETFQEFDQAYWEDRYRGSDQHEQHNAGAQHSQGVQHSHGTGHDRAPSPHLVTTVCDATPGHALDAGCGEGADAIWLARRGWRVTAVDISATALTRARARAEAVGADIAQRIEWVQADLTNWRPSNARYDLVTTHYLHTTASREQLFDGLARAVAPGGTLLIVGHHPDDAHSSAHASGPAVHFTAEEVASGLDLDRWEVLTAETRTRSFPRPDGHELVLHDTVLRARNRS